jgi:2-polyprenyl-6-methoxyphenol hydroxylase-like FAD-dependent oxidoreductase
MFSKDRPVEALVVGAGPVGLYSALALARRGVAVEVVDTGVWPCQHSYALALHPASLALFDELGMKDEILKRAYPVRSLGLWDREGPKAAIRLAEPPEALAVVRQDVLEELLEAALRELGVKVSWRHEVTALEAADGKVNVRVDRFERESRGYIVAHTEWVVAESREFEVPFVVGADGHRSRVRRALNVDFPEVGPALYFAVFEFSAESGLDQETRLVFGPETTDVLWPLPGGACRWSFQLPNYTDEHAEALKDQLLKSGFGYFPTEREKDRGAGGGEQMPQLEESSLREYLRARAPWFKGEPRDVTWRTLVRFEKRLASRFGQGGMWLAGDAAHLTGPAGVQSMNLGLFEGRDLALRIAQVLKSGGGQASLEEFNAHWTQVWRELQGLTGGLEPAGDCPDWLRGYGARLLPCLPAYGDGLRGLAAQVGFRLPA